MLSCTLATFFPSTVAEVGATQHQKERSTLHHDLLYISSPITPHPSPLTSHPHPSPLPLTSHPSLLTLPTPHPSPLTSLLTLIPHLSFSHFPTLNLHLSLYHFPPLTLHLTHFPPHPHPSTLILTLPTLTLYLSNTSHPLTLHLSLPSSPSPLTLHLSLTPPHLSFSHFPPFTLPCTIVMVHEQDA